MPTSNLVDLVNQDERVLGADALQSLDDLAGEGAVMVSASRRPT